MTKLSKSPLNAVFLVILVLSVACLAFSLLIEKKAGLTPCLLCLVQRYTYLALGCLSLLGYLFKWKTIIRWVLIGLVTGGAVIATYHSLAHAKVINSKCSSFLMSPALNKRDFKKQLSPPIPSCINQTPRIFGMPISTMNVLVYAGCGCLLIWRKKVFRKVFLKLPRFLVQLAKEGSTNSE